MTPLAFADRLWESMGPRRSSRRRGRRRAGEGAGRRILLSFAAAYALSLLPADAHFDRYVLPLVPVLAVIAGSRAGCTAAPDRAASRSRGRSATRASSPARPAARRGGLGRAQRPGRRSVAADPSTLSLPGLDVVRLELPGRADPSTPTGTWRGSGRAASSGRRRRRRHRPGARAAEHYPRESAFYRSLEAVRPRVLSAPAGRLGRPWVRVYRIYYASVMELESTGAMGLAVGTAVFLSGAVLLGVEIAASRVLAPTFGSSLYVWGALIGVVLTGLSIGYWLGGVARRPLADAAALHRRDRARRWARPRDPVRRRLGARAGRQWDPGPRLDPLVAAIALFGPTSVVLASVSPIAVRLSARSIDRLGRTAGRLFAISTAGSIAGTFATAFWLVPEHGTDQVLAVGAVALLAAAAAVALVQRLWLRASGSSAPRPPRRSPSAPSRPRRAGRLQGAAARNWSPLYRRARTFAPRASSTRPRSGSAAPASPSATPGTRATTGSSSPTTPIPLPPLRQLVPERRCTRTTHSARASRTATTSASGSHTGRTRGRSCSSGSAAASAPEAAVARLPRSEITTVELDPEVVETAYTMVRAAARRQAPRRDRRRPQVAAEDRRALRRDHDRRLLRGRVPFHLATLEFMRARARAAHAGRRAGTNMIGSVTGGSRRSPGTGGRPTAPSSQPSAPSGVRGRLRPPGRRHPQHDLRRDGTRRAAATKAPPSRGTRSGRRARAGRSGPHAPRHRPLGARDSDGGRPAPDRRTMRPPTHCCWGSRGVSRRTPCYVVPVGRHGLISAVASASDTSTISSPWSAAIRPKRRSWTSSRGLEPVARREDAIARGRRPAALHVPENRHARLEARPSTRSPSRARRRRRRARRGRTGRVARASPATSCDSPTRYVSS